MTIYKKSKPLHCHLEQVLIFPIFLMLCNHSMAAAACIPPPSPVLPESDSAIIKHIDLIKTEFERYFADVSAYSACLDQAHADLVAEVRKITELHTIFLTRAETLGVAGRVATDTSMMLDNSYLLMKLEGHV